MEPKPSALDTAWAVIIGVAVAGDVLLIALVNSKQAPSTALLTAAFALVASEISLVAIWLALGNYPIPIRLLAIVPADGLSFFPFFTRGGNFVAFAACNLIPLVVAVVPLLMRIAGWRLARLEPASESAPAQPGQKSLQFTLRQMFGWTLGVAMVAALVRFVIPPDFQLRLTEDFVAAIAFGLIGGATACGAVWAALGLGKPAGKLAFVAAASGTAALIVCVALHAPEVALVSTICAATLAAILTGGALLLWRAAGFRLLRARRIAP